MRYFSKLLTIFVTNKTHYIPLGLFIIFSILMMPSYGFASTATDTFTDTATTLLENHTSDSGNTWAKQSGASNAVISNANRVRYSNGTIIYVSNWTPASADYDVSADLYIASASGAFTGIGGRAGSSSFTGYYALIDTSSTLRLYRGGNGTPLASQVVTANVGETHTLKLEMRSNTIKVYWDGGVVITVVPTGADIVSTAGRAALYFQQAATDSTGVHMDNFSAVDATSTPLTAGTLSKVSQTSTSFTLSWTAATGGVAPVAAQLQRSASGAGSWSNVSGATTSPVTDTGLTASTAYDYRVAFTDASSTIAYSNTVTATTSANVTLGTYGTVVNSESTLLHYWPMTDSSGTSLSSVVGGIPINLTGATVGVSGQVDGTAVSFNGTSNYGVTAANLDLSSYNKVVVEALLKYTYSSNGVAAWESTSDLNTSTTGFAFFPVESSSNGNSNIILKGGSGYNYGFYTRPTASTWHHVVAVYDKGATTNEVDLYIDGVLQTAGSRPAVNNNTNNFGNDILYLMSRGGSSFFTGGSIQHLAIYSDLSASRILTHYQTAFATSSALAAGALSEVSHSTSTASLSWTSATGGVAPITAQLQRSASGAGSWGNVSNATTSPVTDTGLATSTAYDYRVAFTDASSTVAYSNTRTVTTDAVSTTTTYTVQLTDFWSNNYDNVAAPRQSPFARFVFTTDAASITVTGNTTIYGSYSAYAHLGVRVNGSALSPLVFTANGNQSFTVSLGTGGTVRTVEIITGLQSTAGGATSLGSFITSLTYPNSASFNIQAPIATNSILFYGDSISVGGNSTNPEYQAYVPLLRTTYGFNTMLEGWGYRALYDDASNSTKQNNFVSHIASSTPSIIWFAIGTNDYGLNKWSAASFGTALAAVLDGLHTALPSTRIICQTPLVRSSESANGSGSTLGDYRTQIATICNARSSYATLVDGTSILTLSDMADGLHPTTAGFVKYANRIAPIISQPSYSISGPSSGLVSQASTAFSVALTGTTTFMGDQTITISDGGNGGTFTPSLGSPGVSSVTVTPVNGVTGFTFTYTPASAGSKTLTFTNSQTWNNPSTAMFTSTPQSSTDASLSNLTISQGTLSPVFSSSTISYTANVLNGVTSLTVTPTANQANATITVNGTPVTSGSSSSPISLNVGANTVLTVTLAQDGTTTKTYTIVVTRGAPVVVPPTVNVQNASSVATSSATFNGTITVDGYASSTIVGFNYGTTLSYGSTASTTGTFGTGAFSKVITGLLPNTLYHYQAFAQNSAGVGTSSDATTTTSALPDLTLPQLTSISASPSSSSATITWTTDKLSSSKVSYGLTSTLTDLSTETNISPRVQSHTVTLSNLVSCTTYHYIVYSADSLANTATSSDATFTTTGCSGNTSLIGQTNQGITTNGTTTLVSSGKSFDVNLPTGFSSTTSNVVVQIKSLDSSSVIGSLGNPSGSLSGVGNIVFDVKALINSTTTLDSFDTPVTISYQYTEADVAGFVESTLWLYHYHNGIWTPLDNCQINTGTKTVTCTTSSFSIFSLFAQESQAQTSVSSQTSHSSSGGTVYGCKDQNAINYNYFSKSMPALCQYGTLTKTSSTSTEAYKSSNKFIFTRNLSLHMAGADVKLLQQYLNSKGFLIAKTGAGSPGKETTLFGTMTYKALAKYQKSIGIPATGFFGPLTIDSIGITSTTTIPTTVSSSDSKIQKIYSETTNNNFTQDLKLGSVNEEVRSLQKLLNSLGFIVSTTGPGSAGKETNVFGPATQASLIKYQQSNGITPAVGYFGPMTRGYIATH